MLFYYQGVGQRRTQGTRVQSHFKKRRGRKAVLLSLAGLLPLILCLIFTLIDARQVIKRQQAATASMLLTQAEAISDKAWQMVDLVSPWVDRSCDEINDHLRAFAAIHPYFRSVGIMKKGVITCSSAFGGMSGDLETLIQRPVPEWHGDHWIYSLSGTYGVKDRPAVIYLNEMADDYSTYAIVDGQYLLDFMNAAGKSHGYTISLQFGGGYAIASGFVPPEGSPLLNVTTLKAASSEYPVTVTITSPSSDEAVTWRNGLITFMPMALILSLLLMLVTHNWLQRKLSMADQLRRAIRHREFTVNYQPALDVDTQQCSGAEALMRWQLPDGKWIRPDLFIATAESEGMIVPLTRHLLDLLAEDIQHWQTPPGFHLAINVAGEHIQHPDFVADIRAFAARVAHIKPWITLELTERSLISDTVDVVSKLKQLRSEGIRIAIDDFGTGHCSLSYLQTFPLDYLKIDRGFVNAIESVDGETPVLDAIIMLSHKLKLKVVAEGVETPMQLAYLTARGVHFIQGYLYARPMDNRAFNAFMADQGSTPFTAPWPPGEAKP